jgi:hypothetical protein
MSVPSDSEDQAVPRLDLLPRSPYVLQQLPLDYRWQFTRRHPYYLSLWQYARRDFVPSAPDDPLFAEKAPLVLLLLGVTGDPPDPATPTLSDGSTFAHWESGAVSRPTNFSLAYALVAGLSPSELSLLSGLLFETAKHADVDDRHAYAFLHLARFGPDSLSSPTIAPFLAIDPQASLRAVNRAMPEFHREFQRYRPRSPERRRHDVLPEYLQVFDLREGWTGSDYDVSRELRFSVIAHELRTPISTAHDRYHAAFRYLTGHRYSFSNWFKVFRYRKIDFRPGGMAAPLRRFDRSTTESVTLVSDTRLVRDAEAARPSESASVSSGMADDELYSDLMDLIRLGRSNEQIASEMDLREEPVWIERLLDYLRSRGDMPE